MSKRRWFFLWLLFMGYLILGASIFYNIERDLEEERRREKHRRHIQLQGILEEHIVVQKSVKLNAEEREKSIDVLFSKLSAYCARPLQRSGPNATEEPYTWTYYNSFFFALTTLSTIGYGNLSPTSEHSKIWVILYSLIGIPFNGIVLAHLGEFFGSKFLRAHHRYKNHVYESRLALIRDILMYLIPGMAVFILAPSVIFKYLENWTFIDSIYYSFVSLTTIGYGDFVAGQTQGDDAFDVIYKIFLVFWIMFGLGYLVMILGFISRAMKSKQINKLEKKVAQTLKHTQSKIWNEFLSDVQYLRRILNEMYLMKVKPVYKERTVGRIQLSQSCPNLSEWPVKRPRDQSVGEGEAKLGRPRRRRAFSENGQDEPRLPRVLSDGALGGIDVQATFSGATFDPLFLPNPFGPVAQDDELSDSEELKEGGGVHMFPDEEILSTEDYTNSRVSGDTSWFMGGSPLRRQGRAMSEAQVLPPHLGQQKTWAGAESLHQFALLKAMRAKSEWPLDEEKGLEKGLDSPARGLRRLSMAAINFFSPANKLKKKKFTSDVLKESEKFQRPTYNGINAKHRLSLQEEDMNAMNQEMNYFTNVTEGRRTSILDLLASSNRNSESAISPVLEQTSIADFIRAVQSLKAMEAGLPTSPVLQRAQENLRTRPTGPAPFKGRFNERRFSQVPTGQGNRAAAGLRPRAASIAPVLAGPVDRRLRKLSATTRGSPHSSGRATPIARVFPAPSLVVTSPDGKHKFSITNVDPQPPPFKRADTLKDFGSRLQ